MGIVKTKDLIYNYIRRDEEDQVEEVLEAVKQVNIDIKEGEFVAVLGHNGSGKSTLAKHINALLLPTEGTVWIDGKDTKDESALWQIRQTAGMVFQNPDNQIIASVVEEDVGFGPENIGVPTEEIWKRVDECLGAVDMKAYRKQSPNKLSGGQKQRVAIAGVMAMEPRCIVLDEPTAMLDPNGRHEVIRTIRELNKEERDHDHSDHPLYGRSDPCGPNLCHGRWRSCHGRNTGGDLQPGGKAEGAAAGRSAGDRAGP